MKKRIFAMLLAGAMMLSLAACGGNGDDTKDTDNGDTTTADTTDALPAGIEKQNYEKDFVILYPDWGLYRDVYFVEENTGEAMDVALFNRELKVEEHLGLDITFQMADNNGQHGIGAIYPNVQSMAMTGDNLYQIVLTHCISNTSVMITDGLLLDLNTVNTIDFDHDWWNHVSNDNLEVAGKQFFAISDFIIPDPNAVLFNKSMIEKNDLDNPYDLVRNDEWTLDKMMEMMSVVTLDNGDGTWDLNDTYGLSTCPDWFLSSLTHSMGEQILGKNDDGGYELSLVTDRAYTVFEKIGALVTSSDTFLYPMDKGFENFDPAVALDMSTGRCLFEFNSLRCLYLYRNSDVDYGIIPYPMLDENQDNYISLDWSGLMCAPLVAEDHDIIGEVMELYAYYSSEEVLPAYYDILLGEKLSRDPESREMLDIIFDGIVYDAGMNYFGGTKVGGKFLYLPMYMAKGEVNSFATFLAEQEEAFVAELDAFNEAAASLE